MTSNDAQLETDTLRCWLFGHDWTAIDHEELEQAQETEEQTAVHYSLKFPKEWRCERCGATEDPFESVEWRDADGSPF